VLTAVKNFAREEFELKHRYAMVLHTDEPYAHMYLVIKAMGADGKRLNIRRATLRRASTHWRQRAGAVARSSPAADLEPSRGEVRLLETRREVVRGWNDAADSLVIQGHVDLALAVRRFVVRMPPPRTD
jgi:hypothetical protein